MAPDNTDDDDGEQGGQRASSAESGPPVLNQLQSYVRGLVSPRLAFAF
jgi:hypothetical protein